MPPNPASKTPSTTGKAPAGKALAEKHGVEKKTATVGGEKKKRTKTKEETYVSYIFEVLKQHHPATRISDNALVMLNSWADDISQRVASKASKLAVSKKKSTISSQEVQTAARLIFSRGTCQIRRP